MDTNYQELLRTRMSKESYDKLIVLDNLKVMQFVGYFVEHCNPASVFICTDSENDIQYVRDQALALGEEETLSHSTQTIHWNSSIKTIKSAMTKYGETIKPGDYKG